MKRKSNSQPFHLTIYSDGALPVITQELTSMSTGITYVRFKIGNNNWTSWHDVEALIDSKISSFIPDNGSLTDTYGTTVDIDTVNTVGIWYGASSSSYTFNNLPWINTDSSHPFKMFVFKNGTIYTQVLIDMTTGVIYTRWKSGANGTFNSWHSSDRRYIGATLSRKYYAFGDSTTFGQKAGQASSAGADTYNYPRRVGAYLNMPYDNQGVPGQGIRKDWQTINDTIDNLDMSDADLITVAWAYNDTNSTINMGTYTDTDTTTAIGYYYTIMNKLQTKCPNATIILITGFGGTTTASMFESNYTFLDGTHKIADYYNELEKMANSHGWCCINQAKGCWVNDTNRATLIGNYGSGGSDHIHPTHEGYRHYSNFLCGKISAIYANYV